MSYDEKECMKIKYSDSENSLMFKIVRTMVSADRKWSVLALVRSLFGRGGFFVPGRRSPSQRFHVPVEMPQDEREYPVEKSSGEIDGCVGRNFAETVDQCRKHFWQRGQQQDDQAKRINALHKDGWSQQSRLSDKTHIAAVEVICHAFVCAEQLLKKAIVENDHIHCQKLAVIFSGNGRVELTIEHTLAIAHRIGVLGERCGHNQQLNGRKHCTDQLIFGRPLPHMGLVIVDHTNATTKTHQCGQFGPLAMIQLDAVCSSVKLTDSTRLGSVQLSSSQLPAY
ncbi:hypothetical protein T02_14468 [Trichinella nativa]|uniref:Uncharacterized protein n=1 Tax=Trichinella nativa TaxID=6335 RepID=A0A0V1KWS2_9BILA|nr:hypothetical protein T02_14468 [Trichinella nativa]